MLRRRELSKAMMNRDWPHQVALPSPQVAARFKEIQEACRRLTACLRRGNVDHVVYCFARLEGADEF